MDDTQLLLRIRNGDNAAFGELLAAKDGRLFGIALKITRDRAAAEDAVYDAYEKLIVNIDRIRSAAALDGWLISTVKHNAIDFLRKNARTVPFESSLENAACAPPDIEQAADVADCLACLNEREAHALIMHAEGLRLREIAAACGVSTTSAWALVKKAKKNFCAFYKNERKNAPSKTSNYMNGKKS